MDRRQRRSLVLVVVSVTILVGVTLFVIVDSRYLGVAWVGDVGLVYTSDFYTPNNNASYNVVFHGVNFTFMYWIYPPDAPTDGPYTAHFLIEFNNGSSQWISIQTGSYWTVHGGLGLPLTAECTVDTSPTAGVLYHGYMDSPVGWRFIVSIF